MLSLNGKPLSDEPVDVVMRLLYDGAISEDEARDLVTLVGSLNLNMKLHASPTDVIITVG